MARLALAPLPRRARRRVLIRTDSGGGTRDFLTWLASPSRRLHYSTGMTITQDMQQAILTLPERIWEPAYDPGGQARPGAWVAEITGLLELPAWPAGMRVIAGKECPHPATYSPIPSIWATPEVIFGARMGRGKASDRGVRRHILARTATRLVGFRNCSTGCFRT